MPAVLRVHHQCHFLREMLTADIDIDVSVPFTNGRLTYIIGEVVP